MSNQPDPTNDLIADWATKVDTANLRPHEPFAIYSTGEWDVAVQVATNPHFTDAARDELLAAIRSAVEDATSRVLCLKPATTSGGTR